LNHSPPPKRLLDLLNSSVGKRGFLRVVVRLVREMEGIDEET
jgi:hypothetical protein